MVRATQVPAMATTVAVLVAHGADVTAAGEHGDTPLLRVLRAYMTYATPVLCGSDSTAVGSTPHAMSHTDTPATGSSERSVLLSTVTLLLPQTDMVGCGVHDRDKALHVMLEHVDPKAHLDDESGVKYCEEHLLEVVQLLLRAGANAHAQGTRSASPLELAVANKYTTIVQAMVEHDEQIGNPPHHRYVTVTCTPLRGFSIE